MTRNRVPWRDNGLLFAGIGLAGAVALITTEVLFQDFHYQDPIINFALQADSDADVEDDGDIVAVLSATETTEVKRIISELKKIPAETFVLADFLTQYPEVSDAIWQEVADLATRQHSTAGQQLFDYLIAKYPESESLLFRYAKAAEDDQEAVHRYRKLIKIHPNHQASYINLGLALARLDQHGDVITELTTAIQISSGQRKAKAYSIRASSHLALQNYQGAVDDFQASLEYRPTHAPTWRKLAQAMMLAARPDHEVMAALNSALKLKPDSLYGLHDRGRFYWLEGDIESARNDFEAIRTMAPDYQPARWSLLQLYEAMNKRNSANKEIKWLKNQNLTSTESQLLAGIQYLLDENNADAEQTLKSLLECEPDNELARYYAVLAQIRQKKVLENSELEQFRQLLNHKWLSGLAAQALSEYYLAQENYPDAISTMQSLSYSHADSHYYAYLLGRIYLDADMPLEAASALQRAHLLDKGDTQNLLSLGIAYNRARQTELAIKTYDNILAINNNHREALYNYANIMVRLERLDEAIELFTRLLAVDPDNNNARFRLANVYQDQNDFANSEKILKEVLAENATHHRARELLAENLLGRGALKQALAEVERLLVLDQDRVSGLMLKSDILRDLGQLQLAAETLWTIPVDDYSRNTVIKMYNIGKRALDDNQLVLAEACNRRVIEQDPLFDKAWVNLTSALLRSQKAEQVIALLENQQPLMEQNHKLTINLAEAYLAKGQSRVAINLLEPLKQRDLLSDEGQLVLAKSYSTL